MEYQQLQDEIKAAMKARDNHRRDILRQVHTELKAIKVNERREVTEADVDAMWGIVQVGLSLQSHDPSQRSQGFLTLAGGLVITFAKEILDLITA